MITKTNKNQINTDICNDYKNGVTIAKIIQKYRSSYRTIKKILVENKVPIRTVLDSRSRKYTYDKTFFKTIDTEEKAYWLGFLYADGCISKYSVNLLLDQLDRDAVEKFKESIKYTGIVELRTDEINYGEKYGVKKVHTAKVRIHSVELCKDLIRLGCPSQKTFKIQFPSEEIVPSSLLRHFIRGYLDGDGSVWEKNKKAKNGKRRGYASITSTDHMVRGIKDFLVKECNLDESSVFIRPHPTSNGISIIQLCSFHSMEKLRNLLYNNANIYMERKKQKFYELEFDHVKPPFEIAKDKVIYFLLMNKILSTQNIIAMGFSKAVSYRAVNTLEKEGKIKLSHNIQQKKYYILNA